ncbi:MULTISPECIES: hypothetical protein [unclassified Gilliamella]|uniref:hypothetical protein n=1 Tax=unclassified Gilliamella TaxID=2685620 RepID=UPI001305A97E|nr:MULTISPECIES: hypothetical protein [unclassified Gilliamella]MWN91259.1 hypothetical protein [Gilliamella sp. Pra-s65]MWP48520.1 hypothetical protein [Gilliamella sp. Lep-s35]MWP68582.1 hypothetical protein [Gilliamella sp. Lep-s5]MWP74235.1 hypothetical protein [Gilliamella sp. Pra-s52]MWP76750.1 hypothetical protein [Gilliamella sp. Lep-s21]
MIHGVSKIKPFPTRMPDDLREWYEKEAECSRRSLNFVIVEALAEHKEKKIKQREVKNANI